MRVRLYRTEHGTDAVQTCLAPDDELIISEFTPLEFESACLGWVRQGLVDEYPARQRLRAFECDRGNYRIVRIDSLVWARAYSLLGQFAVNEGLRPPDALQLATALEEHRRDPLDAFVVADLTLASVADTCGLRVAPQPSRSWRRSGRPLAAATLRTWTVGWADRVTAPETPDPTDTHSTRSS